MSCIRCAVCKRNQKTRLFTAKLDSEDQRQLRKQYDNKICKTCVIQIISERHHKAEVDAAQKKKEEWTQIGQNPSNLWLTLISLRANLSGRYTTRLEVVEQLKFMFEVYSRIDKGQHDPELISKLDVAIVQLQKNYGNGERHIDRDHCGDIWMGGRLFDGVTL